MRLRLPISWYDLKDSMWYRPGLMTLAALILSLLTVQLDIYLFGDQRVELPLLFQGGVEGARGVLSAIAGTMMTVATTAFSVTLVALQLGSSQFSPRILRSFTGDVVNQTVLGIFIATFAFSLSVLRTVRSETDEMEAFVPTVSVTVALLLAFMSIGSLIYFFHYSTRTIQASVVIDRTYNDTSNLISKHVNWLKADGRRLLQERMTLPDRYREVTKVYAKGPGYLQDSNADALVRVANNHNVLIRLTPQLGDFLNTGSQVATVWRDVEADSGEQLDAETLESDILAYLETGLERTLEYDSLFGMQQLTDIALLTLSTGTNDPTTAVTLVDRMSTAVIEAAQVAGVEAVFTDGDGAIRLIHPVPRFIEFVRTPFDQIRHYAIGDPFVTAHVLRTLEVIASNVRPEHVDDMKEIVAEYLEAAAMQSWIKADVDRVREAARWAHDPDIPRQPWPTGRP